MAKPKPEKKPAAAAPPTKRILPMELQIGDRIVDETGEWEVIGRPYTTAGGKMAHVGSDESASLASPTSGCGARMSASA